jgi:hypothetical protein
VRILYVASDQVVPGRTGGSVHVLEVARGLAALGHDVSATAIRVSTARTAGSSHASRSAEVVWLVGERGASVH